MARARTIPDPEQLLLFEEPVSKRVEPLRAAGTPADAPSRPSAAPPAPPGQAAPAGLPIFAHPHATRELHLDGHAIGYALRRVRRRTIGFIVGPEGLCVNAPRWVAVADIELALREKSRWIVRKLAEQHERQRRLQQARVDWRDGASIPFLGAPVIVVLDARATGAVLHPAEAPAHGVPPLALHVGLPPGAAAEQIRDAVQSWLQRQARRIFEERCRHFAAMLGVRFRRLALSSAQTRWGSASADGSIRLNWRLIHFAQPIIDYVVVHELAHLRHMDHSPRFWDVVRSVVPDYKERRGGLRDEVLPVFG